MNNSANAEEFRKMSPDVQISLIEESWKDVEVEQDFLEFLMTTFIAQYLEGLCCLYLFVLVDAFC